MPGTISGVLTKIDKYTRKIVYTCVGAVQNGDTGTVPDRTTDEDRFQGDKLTGFIKGWSLVFVVAYPTPSGKAPDAADITVKQTGIDLLGAGGANLIHATNPLSVPAKISTSVVPYPIYDVLTVGVTNHVTASGEFTIELIFKKPINYG